MVQVGAKAAGVDPVGQMLVGRGDDTHVDPDRPELLVYEYVQQIGHVIDELPDGPLTVVHLGAGALTLPRYVAATRPGSPVRPGPPGPTPMPGAGSRCGYCEST